MKRTCRRSWRPPGQRDLPEHQIALIDVHRAEHGHAVVERIGEDRADAEGDQHEPEMDWEREGEDGAAMRRLSGGEAAHAPALQTRIRNGTRPQWKRPSTAGAPIMY